MRNLLEDLAHCYEMAPHEFDEDPVEVFKRDVYVHPFHEEDPIGLIKLLGPDRVLFGSDYPHPEGMSDPISFVDELKGLDEDRDPQGDGWESGGSDARCRRCCRVLTRGRGIGTFVHCAERLTSRC